MLPAKTVLVRENAGNSPFSLYNAGMTAQPPSRSGPQGHHPHIDYALARRSVLRDFRRGMLTTLDVCDAHPELMRVAEHHGHLTERECPICADNDVRSPLCEVDYLYGDGLRKSNGRPVTEYNQLEDAEAAATKSGKTFHKYRVEVCLECKWNFLIRREDRG